MVAIRSSSLSPAQRQQVETTSSEISHEVHLGVRVPRTTLTVEQLGALGEEFKKIATGPNGDPESARDYLNRTIKLITRETNPIITVDAPTEAAKKAAVDRLRRVLD
jgi:hypothetical protein